MYHLGLIGYPITHSKSPQIHHHFLSEAGLSGRYQLVELEPHEIEAFLTSEASNHYHGLNVTAPYKEKVIPFLDQLDPLAEKMKAVNTIHLMNGKRIGYNTDGIGYVEALRQAKPHFFSIPSPKILILGAGGAAKGIAYAFDQYGDYTIDIANRTIAKAQTIADHLKRSKAIRLTEAERSLSVYDLIIQTTTVGMEPNSEGQIVSLEHALPETIVSDIIYHPAWTNLLKQAHQRGMPTVHGMDMLIMQAAKAFEIWTGHRPRVNTINRLKERLHVDQ